MLDTIKVKIPLNERQHKKIAQEVTDSDKPQWVLYHPKTGELEFLRVKGLAEADQNSYHRQIRFDLPLFFVEGQTFLVCEFSLPKFFYGHNLSLLYDWIGALRKFKRLLEKQFGLTSTRWRHKLAEPELWEILRVDLCYAFQFPSQDTCHKFLQSLKHIAYPRKKPIIYPEAILFAGATYSFKIYEKQPEFKSHDLKELVKAKAHPDWVSYLSNKSEGVLRIEATLRRKYLKVNGLTAVTQLLSPSVKFHLPDDWPSGDYGRRLLHWLIDRHMGKLRTDSLKLTESLELVEPKSGIAYLHPDPGTDLEPYDPSEGQPEGTIRHKLSGRKVLIEVSETSQAKLQFFLDKFLGGCPAMQTVDQIRITLSEHYKPAKVGRLVAFWLYVRKFGSVDAKEQFGHNSYYVSKRDLKKAGVSLFEAAENVIPIDKDFVKSFRLQVPSQDVTNRHDDFPDGDNLLNLPLAK